MAQNSHDTNTAMSEVALRRIKAAKEDRHTTLDLSHCGIHDELPEALGELTWLLKLNLRGNRLGGDSPTNPKRHPGANRLG